MLYRLGRRLFLDHPRLLGGPLGQLTRVVPRGVRYGAGYRRTRRLLARAERWSRDELDAYRLERLRDQVEFATARVPFYRDRYREAGVSAASLRTLDDVRRLPTIDKNTVLHEQDRFLADDVDASRLMTFLSGGTSGTNITWRFDEAFRQREQAYIWNIWERAGYDGSQRTAILQGRDCPPDVNDGLWYRDHVGNAIVLSAHRLTRETASRYLDALRSERPRVLLAFPSLATLLAGWAQELGFDEKIFDLVLCGSETLYPQQRELLESVWKAPVRIHYGHTESCILLSYCRDSNAYHEEQTYGYAEFLRDDGECAAAGEVAELVGTCFDNRAMPLIRYRTQDWIEVGDGSACPVCPLPYPVHGRIHGRTSEFIRTPSGRAIAPIMLEYAVDHHPGFADLQLVQHALDDVEVLVVKDRDFTDAVLADFLDQLRQRIGDDVEYRVSFVDAIPRSRRQKKSLVRSMLGSDDGERNA